MKAKKITTLLLILVLTLSFSFIYADQPKSDSVTPDYVVYCAASPDSYHHPTNDVYIFSATYNGEIEQCSLLGCKYCGSQIINVPYYTGYTYTQYRHYNAFGCYLDIIYPGNIYDVGWILN